MGPAVAVTGYLDAFTVGDFDSAAAFVADDFMFAGPFAQYESKVDFFCGAAGLRGVLRGHTLLHRWEDGPDVCSVYLLQLEGPGGAGALYTSEWNTVADNLVVSARLVFDTTAFRALLPAAA
jgi:hypothetical protein